MLESKLRNVMLVDELQLGDDLNRAVNSGNRAQFALLLSMLSSDMCDAPQFSDPIKEPFNKEDLRARFELPKESPQYADKSDFERAQGLSKALESEGQNALNLMLCLRSEPLCDRERALSPDVYSSLSPLEREKFDIVKDSKPPRHVPLKQLDDGSGMALETEQSRAMLKPNETQKIPA